jgi:hypothetical protein
MEMEGSVGYTMAVVSQCFADSQSFRRVAASACWIALTHWLTFPNYYDPKVDVMSVYHTKPVGNIKEVLPLQVLAFLV